jgi:hypothetical protein
MGKRERLRERKKRESICERVTTKESDREREEL